MPEAVKVNGDRPDNVVLQTLAGQRIEMDGFNKQIRITDAYSNVIQMGEQGIRLGKLDSKTQKAVLGESAVSVQKEMYSAVLAAFDTIKQAAELSNKTLVVQGAPSPFSLILASMFGLKLPDTPVTPEGEEPPPQVVLPTGIPVPGFPQANFDDKLDNTLSENTSLE